MVAYSSITYGLCGGTLKPLPERSRLYRFEPIGIGTLYVEQAASYIARLAQAHCVKVGALLDRESLRSLFTQSALPVHSIEFSHSSLVKSPWLVNTGVGSMQGLIEVLGMLTQRHDLQFLTMFTWSDVLSLQDVVRRGRAWCPACYAEWQSSGVVIYDPLFWSFKMVTICPRHECLLQMMCPHCQKTQKYLIAKTRLGYCSHCGQWLGCLSIKRGHFNKTEKGDESAWEIWVAEAIGELLATAPHLKNLPSREELGATVSAYIGQVAGGRDSEVAYRIGVYPDTVRNWRQAIAKMPLEVLLRLCYGSSVSPLQFLVGGCTLVDLVTMKLPNNARSRIKSDYSEPKLAMIQKKLENLINTAESPPPSLVHAAREVGCSKNTLTKHFPKLSRAVSSRYLAYREFKSNERKQKVQDDVRRIILSLQAQGDYPSSYKVQEQTRCLGYWKGDVYQLWTEIMQELGLKVESNSDGTL